MRGTTAILCIICIAGAITNIIQACKLSDLRAQLRGQKQLTLNMLNARETDRPLEIAPTNSIDGIVVDMTSRPDVTGSDLIYGPTEQTVDGVDWFWNGSRWCTVDEDRCLDPGEVLRPDSEEGIIVWPDEPETSFNWSDNSGFYQQPFNTITFVVNGKDVFSFRMEQIDEEVP